VGECPSSEEERKKEARARGRKHQKTSCERGEEEEGTKGNGVFFTSRKARSQNGKKNMRAGAAGHKKTAGTFVSPLATGGSKQGTAS